MGMELAMSELPLALFSTLAPMGAGAFTLLAIAFCTRSYDDEVLKRIDKLTVVPLVVTIIGFICAFFHLASPMHAFGVFANLGTSPMSNEILVGVIFCVVAIIYWIVAMATRMSAGLRKGLSWVTAIVGLVFCLFIGLAYGMDTIPSWSNAMVPLSTLCFGLLGGTAVGLVVLYWAGAPVAEGDAKGFGTAAMALAWIGALGSALFFCINLGMTSGMENNMMTGAELVGGVMGMAVIGVVLMLAAGVVLTLEIRKQRNVGYAWLAVILAFVGILLVRLCFYGIELSVGLGI